MTPDKKLIAIMCRADNGCIACITQLLAHYCVEYNVDATAVAKAAAETGLVDGKPHEDFLHECIVDRINQIISPKH